MNIEVTRGPGLRTHLPYETMKAVVVEEYGAPLKIKEVPKPVAGLGEVIVKTIAAGLCHTDIHAAHGD